MRDVLHKVLIKLLKNPKKPKQKNKQTPKQTKKPTNQTHTLHSPSRNLKASVYPYPGKLFMQKRKTDYQS